MIEIIGKLASVNTTQMAVFVVFVALLEFFVRPGDSKTLRSAGFKVSVFQACGVFLPILWILQQGKESGGVPLTAVFLIGASFIYFGILRPIFWRRQISRVHAREQYSKR